MGSEKRSHESQTLKGSILSKQKGKDQPKWSRNERKYLKDNKKISTVSLRPLKCNKTSRKGEISWDWNNWRRLQGRDGTEWMGLFERWAGGRPRDWEQEPEGRPARGRDTPILVLQGQGARVKPLLSEWLPPEFIHALLHLLATGLPPGSFFPPNICPLQLEWRDLFGSNVPKSIKLWELTMYQTLGKESTQAEFLTRDPWTGVRGLWTSPKQYAKYMRGQVHFWREGSVFFISFYKCIQATKVKKNLCTREIKAGKCLGPDLWWEEDFDKCTNGGTKKCCWGKGEQSSFQLGCC